MMRVRERGRGGGGGGGGVIKVMPDIFAPKSNSYLNAFSSFH